MAENEVLTKEILSDPLCVNITVGGKGNPKGGHRITAEAKAHLSKIHTGRPKSAETRKRIGEAKKGVPSPLKGIPRPPEVVEKIKAGNQGKTCSETTKQKIREKRLGVPRTEITKQKLRELKSRFISAKSKI